MISFRPLPARTIYGIVQGEPMIESFELEIPVGKVCRYLALPGDVGSLFNVSLVEGESGFPGSLFVANPLGPAPELRGGYIGEHVGPMTLRFWVRSRAGAPAPFGGAYALEGAASDAHAKIAELEKMLEEGGRYIDAAKREVPEGYKWTGRPLRESVKDMASRLRELEEIVTRLRELEAQS